MTGFADSVMIRCVSSDRKKTGEMAASEATIVDRETKTAVVREQT